MAKDRRRQQRATLKFPGHALSPEDLLHFIETTVFTKAWGDLGLDDEHDLMALQVAIMCAPKRAPVIPATGGLRKLRFAPADWGTGTSGGVRVCYVYFEDYGIVLLVHVYDKRSKDDLTADEKKVIRDYIRREKQALDRRRRI